MELSKNKKTIFYQNLGSELSQLREASFLPEETVAKYANIAKEELANFEAGCADFGNLRLHAIMSWAGIFGKKLTITLEDFSDEEKVEAFELVKNKLSEVSRLISG